MPDLSQEAYGTQCDWSKLSERKNGRRGEERCVLEAAHVMHIKGVNVKFQFAIACVRVVIDLVYATSKYPC